MPPFEWASRDPSLASAIAAAVKEDTAWSQAKEAAHIFDLHPPLGKAGLALTLEGTAAEGAVNVLLTGNTWPWRSALDAANVPGGYVEEATGTKTYVRMLTDVRVGETEDTERLRQLFEDVLRSFPVLLRAVDDEDRDNTSVASARSHLLALPSI